MKLENTVKQWRIHYTYHTEVSVDNCKFCTRHSKSNRGNRSSNVMAPRMTDRTFQCIICMETKNIFYRSHSNRKQCIKCYWKIKPTNLL